MIARTSSTSTPTCSASAPRSIPTRLGFSRPSASAFSRSNPAWARGDGEDNDDTVEVGDTTKEAGDAQPDVKGWRVGVEGGCALTLDLANEKRATGEGEVGLESRTRSSVGLRRDEEDVGLEVKSLEDGEDEEDEGEEAGETA